MGTSNGSLFRTVLLSFVALAALCIFDVGYFAPHGSAQVGQIKRANREAAFGDKADKILKHVRWAVGEDRASTVKGRLTKETSEVERLSRTVGLKRLADNTVSVDVAVRLTDESTDELKAAGFAVAARLGDMATLATDVDRLPDLASLSSVRKIFAAVYRYPLNDRARQAVGIDDGSSQRAISQTGRGVIVGIIDTGIDFRHLDFTVPGSSGGQTRIKAMLDMTVFSSQTQDPNWNYSLPGQTTPIGHLYTEADINAALQSPKPADQNSDPVKERDKNGHGTHVAGTAAGNGLSSPTSGTYAGMAPEADLIIVKANRQNDGSASFRSTDLINALQFIQQKAAELGEPFVINMSLGGQLGSHDGTSPDERAIDSLVGGGPGRIVCVAAGNEGDSNIHARATIPAGNSLTLNLNAEMPSFIDVFEAGSDRFTVTLTRPDGGTLGPVAYDQNGFSFPNGQASDQYLQIFNANDDKGDSDPSNDQPEIFVIFKVGAPNGTWKITLQDPDGNPNQSFDAWAVGGNVSFTSFVDNSSHLVASPGTARGAITVGAFVTRSSSLVLGAFTPYTSPGPTVDGRLKPEVEAPGHYLYSAKSTDVTSQGVVFTEQLPTMDPNSATDYLHYGGLAGTSMATSVTAGAIALFLQSNPSLTIDQIKDSIENTTVHDPFTGLAAWDPRAGFGQLNIAAAIQLGGRPVYSISGHVTNAPANGVSMTLGGSQSKSTFVDSSGNYSFRRLLAGGTYTITPATSGPYQFTFSPQSYTFANLSANQVADFTATRVEYSVSGYVRDQNGNGISGVQILSQILGSQSVTTDGNGYYLFANLAAGQSYTIVPIQPNYTFSPDRQNIPNLSRNQNVNFIATPAPKYRITGRITDLGGNGLRDVFVNLDGPTFRGGTTDNNGNYFFGDLLAGAYKVTPRHNQYLFDPPEQTFGSLSSDQIANFRALRKVYLAGRVVDSNGVGVGGFPLTLTGSQSRTITTFRDGNYVFTELPERGSFSITPSGLGYLSNPASLTFTNVGVNVTNANFVLTGSPNPIDDARTFVRQHYLDFLSREPDQGGWDYWTGRITECGNDALCVHQRRIGVSAAFFIELEFQETGYVIYRLYRAAYGVISNEAGRVNMTYAQFGADRAQLVGGPGLQQSTINFGNNFVQRAEFKQAYPDTMTSVEFVNKLFNTANLIGAENASRRQTEMDALANGSRSRAQVLLDVIEINEFKTREYNPAFVLMQYFGYLRRDPEQGGYDFWLNVLNNREPNNFRAMVCAFITSSEYQLRFSTAITRANRDCAQ